MEDQILNYTPHTVNVAFYSPLLCGNVEREFPSAGVARVRMNPEKPLCIVDGVPVVETYSTGVIVGLPEARDGVYLIVSLVVYLAAGGRHDLLVTHGAVRNQETNQIMYCTGLCRPALTKAC